MSNEKLEAGLTSHLTQELGMTTDKPTETGLWLCSCDENDGEWCPVIISTGRNGELIATETIGSYQLDAYHSNLSNVKWRIELTGNNPTDVSNLDYAKSI